VSSCLLPEVPDTVVLAVNPLRAAGFTRQAAEAGVPAVIIPGGGVVEGGVAAARMQAEVAAIARAHGTTILGPNCMGLIDLTSGCATYIDEIHPFLRRGRVAGISQSGSVADTFLHSGTRIGWSRIVSSGSEVVIDLCDHLAYSLEDPDTEAIVLFLEGIRRPERFLALADRALALGKPILAVKVGRSRQARAAAIAHTGALAGEDRAAEAAFRAVGIVRFDDLDDLLEAAALVDGMRASGRTVGRGRTAVVTVSTGEGSLVADLAVRTGLDLPPVPETARAKMAADMPTLGYIGNPMDPWGAAEATPAYRSCFTALADSGAYDVLALVHDFPFRSTQGELDLALELGGVLMAATSDRTAVLPVFVSLTSGDPSPEIQVALEAAGGAPILRGTTEAFGSIARLARWQARRSRRLADGPVRPEWLALATGLPRYGRDPAAAGTPAHDIQAEALDIQAETEPPVAGASASVRSGQALPERESLETLRAAGLPVVTAVPAPAPTPRSRPRRTWAGRSSSSSTPEAWPTRATSGAWSSVSPTRWRCGPPSRPSRQPRNPRRVTLLAPSRSVASWSRHRRRPGSSSSSAQGVTRSTGRSSSSAWAASSRRHSMTWPCAWRR
jgi:acetyltransferase